MLSDLRYGAKMLWKSKGLTLTAMLSLAIGIGANSAIFSLVNSILFRPRAVAHPEQLVELYVGESDQPYQTTSYPSYVELRDRNEVFTGLAAYSIQQFKLMVQTVSRKSLARLFRETTSTCSELFRTKAARFQLTKISCRAGIRLRWSVTISGRDDSTRIRIWPAKRLR